MLGNAVAQSLQIVAMERFAPRYDARALTILQMGVACIGFAVLAVAAGNVEAPPDARRGTLVDGRLRGRPRVPRGDLGAVADDAPRARRSFSRWRRRSRPSSVCSSSPSAWAGPGGRGAR